MRLTFQQKLFTSFIVIFAAFAVGIVAFEQSRARRYKTEALEERLDAYADQVLRNAPSEVFPPELRITLVERNGRVASDNMVDPATMENHAGRPEIVEAVAEGRGSDIRTSATNNQPYLYYARDEGEGRIVRVALPYDIEVRSFLKPDNGFLYFTVALFLIGLGVIYYIGRYFGNAVERLRQHEAREKTRQLKQEMTGNIAHELRTPVTSIRGFLEIVLMGSPGSEKTREYLERAYAQTRTLSELISDMSLLTRLDEKRDGFKFSEVDAAELLARVEADAADALAAKGIGFHVEIPDGLVLRGNEILLYSVFRNLTDNVISHAGEGVEIRVAAEKSPGSGLGAGTGMVRFTFTDTGRGIADQAHLDRLFERFYRVDKGRTRDAGGSGLGLSIVKNTIELHGGRISVRPNRTYVGRSGAGDEAHGLEFVFLLPGE